MRSGARRTDSASPMRTQSKAPCYEPGCVRTCHVFVQGLPYLFLSVRQRDGDGRVVVRDRAVRPGTGSATTSGWCSPRSRFRCGGCQFEGVGRPAARGNRIMVVTDFARAGCMAVLAALLFANTNQIGAGRDSRRCSARPWRYSSQESHRPAPTDRARVDDQDARA